MKKIMINPKLKATFLSEYQQYNHKIDNRIETIIYTCKEEFKIEDLEYDRQENVKSLVIQRVNGAAKGNPPKLTDMVQGFSYVLTKNARALHIKTITEFAKEHKDKWE